MKFFSRLTFIVYGIWYVFTLICNALTQLFHCFHRYAAHICDTLYYVTNYFPYTYCSLV